MEMISVIALAGAVPHNRRIAMADSWARIFWATTGRNGQPPASLEATLVRLLEASSAEYPSLGIAPERFVRRLAEVLSATESLDSLDRLHAPDLYLCCACIERHPEALAIFDRKLLSRLEVFLSRMKQTSAFVDEVRQILREKLFIAPLGKRPKLADYSGQGALANWIRVIATRTAIDLVRKHDERRQSDTDMLERDPRPVTSDIELGYVKERYRTALNQALQESVVVLSGEQRNLLRMHFLESVTLDQLAALFRVHRVTISRRLLQAREAILGEVRRLVCVQLGADSAEFESIIGLVRSRLDLSLPGLLTHAAH
jgi:RNA polymerase sigma-70 factor (ECF subfamily)